MPVSMDAVFPEIAPTISLVELRIAPVKSLVMVAIDIYSIPGLIADRHFPFGCHDLAPVRYSVTSFICPLVAIRYKCAMEDIFRAC
jgi:hypothetical protein